ncbi:recombinase family protein [Streptomyces sp. NPDC002537]
MTDTAAPARAELAFSLRLSRSSDESSSLDVQLRACRLKAEALGFAAETIAAAEANAYVDDGVSGGSALEARKKGMARIMAARPAVVIAWKLDRFARSVREFQKLMDWADENGVRLVTSDSLLDSADKSGTGRLIATIIAAVAEWELGMITDRSEAAHEERRAQGRWISGKAPFPYVMERRDGKAYLAEDADAFALVRKQIDILLARGRRATLAATARALPIGRQQWRNLLHSVALRGWREFKGELWGALIAGHIRWLGRSPEREPEIIAACSRLARLRTDVLRCEPCDAFGPAEAVGIGWRTPIQRGGKRTRENLSMMCRGCWIESGRTDWLPVPSGARIHEQTARSGSPISVIEL